MALTWLKSPDLRTDIQTAKFAIRNSTSITDSMGGWTHTFTTAETVDGILRDLNESESKYWDKVATTNSKMLIIDYTTTITEKSQVLYDSSITYKVIGVKDPNQAHHHLEVLVELVE